MVLFSLADRRTIGSAQKKQLKSPFWEEVFNAWRELQLKLQIYQININTCNIWNNENIKVDIKQFVYKDWAKRGVYMINDVLDETGKIMPFQKFKDTYNIQTNFLTYHGVITAIRFYIKKSNIPINDLEKLNGPLIPNIIKMFMKSQKGSKDMYHILDSNSIKLKCEEK